jgi:hypothetical protein
MDSKNAAVAHYADGRIIILGHKPTLKELQEIVGGYIEVVYRTRFNPTFQGQMIVNEDGYSMSLPVNTKGTEVYGDPNRQTVGNIVILTGKYMIQ